MHISGKEGASCVTQKYGSDHHMSYKELLHMSSKSVALSHGGGLANYLNNNKISFTNDVESNILQCWRNHKLTYQVLSILTCDVLSIPVLPVSPESVFSQAGRILEERRTNLTPDLMKTLIIVNDGELARMRAQHAADNIELASTLARSKILSLTKKNRKNSCSLCNF